MNFQQLFSIYRMDRDMRPDDSLCLGQEDYLESVGYSEGANITLEERRLIVTQEASMMARDSVYLETTVPDEEQNYEDPETGMSLEEEEEKSVGRYGNHVCRVTWQKLKS